jgi:hypothetical protein
VLVVEGAVHGPFTALADELEQLVAATQQAAAG